MTGNSFSTVARRCGHSAYIALTPPAKLSLSEWADEHAVLSNESSAESGRWKTLPYQKGIMDALTDPLIEQVTVMKSARVGYTKIINNFIAYHIHQDPCSIMVVQPTIEDAEGYSKEEIAPMIRDTKCLEGLIQEAKAKDGSNTLLIKLFPGGTLGIVGANSPRGFRRVSRRVVLFDEVDAYPVSAGTEGDQIKLGIRRSEYFWNRKIVAGSTPLVKDASRIERLFERSDKRRYYVPCPTCGHMDYFVFTEKKEKEVYQGHFMKWPKEDPLQAYFVCSANGCVIEHKDKRSMIEKGEWRATHLNGGVRHRGFHIWSAYSYSPNASWGALALEFLEARKDPEELKTFINTVLGEVWEEEYSAKIGADGLRGRAEFYTSGVASDPVLIVTAGIDVQDNRIECTKYGYAVGEESWVISHDVIYGDPSKPEIYKQLDNLLMTKIKRESTGEHSVSAAAIDTGGHHTHEVYQYVRERKRLGFIIGVKGQSQRNKPAIGKATAVDINLRNQSLKGGALVYPMGSDTIKALIYGRLKLVEPGPGYVHFHTDLGPEFFEQLTAEKQVTRFVKGHAVKDWIKKSGARNEALDCAVLAYAALQWLYTRYNRKTIFEQFARKLGVTITKPDVLAPQTTEIKADITENKPEENKIRQNQRGVNIINQIRRGPRRGGGFVGGF
jgi:phage terminase large subunit GpA-like protein